ncbi:J-domain-containing protein [Paenibacillus sp. GYB003]|uniref:DnaJ family domain-containing protein n=1 Tax=Paenibacillus sp. GYB003 TaxID=2994392 RepID=UPI002F96E233
MTVWFRRNKSGKIEAPFVPTGPAPTPVGGEVYENAASTIIQERRMQHWIDEAIRDCQKNGGLDHLSGKGKPIDVPTGDIMNSILKNANYLPPWLELQHEIRDDIRALLRHCDEASDDPGSIQTKLDAINKKIARYNTIVPTPVLQKGRLHADSVRRQANSWE